ncbi:beta-glucan synthesis-associated [Stereum hirsutum FP-91666 SS1]|uniref:beta-glucan synthesis-associated n=1 Tax=Stereum hirsutum (strain FP-91666) TaxID=721885 RepID=UPI000440F688|nr:beta-glucan synthesis-associated [Stereum hirsutum FP-91666 SS1]EIM92127.1 beta-glucan synthesis-associated [Stereum hirsutum FP-91666 SS1]
MAAPEMRYYPAANTPSTTNLLAPNARGPGVQAALAQGSRNATPMSSTTSLNDSPYPAGQAGGMSHSSMTDKFSLSPDPASWGADLSPNNREPDDYLHNPDPRRDRKNDQGGNVFTARGIANLGCLALIALGIFALFAGYPVASYVTKHGLSLQGGFNIGGTNASGQIPSMNGNWGLIDLETPDYAKTRKSFMDDTQELVLVWSDEFNVDGRTFYPGDDPYWEAVDLHYWQTNNLEWYDPAAVTTKDGALEITLSAKETHDLNYQGGMIQTWNKFCFTGGIVETAVTLPGTNNIVGLWPAVWTMGNLGRAGFGASLEGMWPYTYDSCDVGTVANQSVNGLPTAALENGDAGNGGLLSFLPGQRLSRCTCTGESHPGPMHEDGTYVGRSAPEIDIFEAQITGTPLTGQVSQSGQFAPFNAAYTWPNTTDNLSIYNSTITELNSYKGGVYQQAVSGVTQTEQGCYELETGCFAVYGIEYKPGFDDAYITWIASNTSAWTVKASGMGADTAAEIGPRAIPQEPLYLLANLGMSTNFGTVDLDHLTFPAVMRIDYIRVYQYSDSINIGCDPPDFPTATYINEYIEAYTNPNFTTWKDDYGQPFPKNSFLDQC